MERNGMTEIGPAVHPRDGAYGVVYKTKVGVEILLTPAGTFRTLPADWRDKQPKEEN